MAEYFRKLPNLEGGRATWLGDSPASVLLRNEFFGVASSGPSSLDANGIVTGAVVVGNPSVAQTHSLSSVGLTSGNPVAGNPTLAITVTLSANNIVLGSPVILSTTLSQRHSLSPTALVSGSPTVGTTSLEERHNLNATSIVVGSPVLGVTSLASVHNLISQAIEAGAPEFSSVVLSQAIVLTANGIVLGQPFTGNPNLFQYNLSDLQINYSKPRTTVVDKIAQESRVSTLPVFARASRLSNEAESRVLTINPQNRVLKL